MIAYTAVADRRAVLPNKTVYHGAEQGLQL